MKKIAISFLILTTLGIANTFTEMMEKIGVVNTVNTYTDNETGLMWQDNGEVKTNDKDWNEAMEYCKNLKLEGFSDWRLPNRTELISTLDDTLVLHTSFRFKNFLYSEYWSSSIDVRDSSKAWFVESSGYVSSYNKDAKKRLRCVRDSKETLNIDPFTHIIDTYIQTSLKNIPKPPQNIELVKGEFEKTSDFDARVKATKEKQQKEIEEYNQKIGAKKQEAQKEGLKLALETLWGKPILSEFKYDADNEYFVANLRFEAKSDFSKNIAIKIDPAFAQSFKNSTNTLKPQAVFDYDGKSVSLKEVRVPYQKKEYIAMFTDMKIEDTKIAVNLQNNITADTSSFAVSINDSGSNKFDTSKLQDHQELARILASTPQAKTDKKKWLVIIGIERYDSTDAISYATRSAEMFRDVGMKKLGVPKENVVSLIDSEATQGKIKTAFNKLQNRVKEGDTIYFYYNGHGIPVASQNWEPFMLAKDSDPDDVGNEKYFALNNIYGTLSSTKASKVVAFVDSCFSGATDGNTLIKGVAATKMKPKIVQLDNDKMVVLTAGKDTQYSNGYNQKGYRMFSYFVMKNLLETKESNPQIEQLYKKIKEETYDASLREYGDNRTQEPTIEGNKGFSL
jgi:hypothetical protein